MGIKGVNRGEYNGTIAKNEEPDKKDEITLALHRGAAGTTAYRHDIIHIYVIFSVCNGYNAAVLSLMPFYSICPLNTVTPGPDS
jgi:hypothetical protein